MGKNVSILKLVGCVVLMVATAQLLAETVWLSSFDLQPMPSGWSVPKADLGVAGKPISIGGKPFARGVGTHANSRLRVNLGGKAKRFVAQVGVDDSAGDQGSVEFIVTGDGKELWRSGVMTGNHQAKSLDVNLSGVKVLTLRATDGGDGESHDHADWADAQIIIADGAAKPVSLPPCETFTLQAKTFSVNFEVGDPKTELMLCSGGGGRVDYGALKYFHEFWPSDNTDPVTRVTMQWDYSHFFPAMAMASHVTHAGQRPMHFACSVAMSARFGMDLDLVKLSAEDKGICAGAISAYKRIREVTHLGDLYRLERPHAAARGAINFTAPDRAKAVLFVFQLQDGRAAPVLPQGLNPAMRYTVHELNPAPGRAPLPQEGQTFTGEELMREGIVPSCRKALEACVVELAP